MRAPVPYHRVSHPLEAPPDRAECDECGCTPGRNPDCDACERRQEVDSWDAGDPDATPRRRRTLIFY